MDGTPRHLAHSRPPSGNEFQTSDNRWVRVNGSVTREGGRLVIWSDITEAKNQSERLRRARDAAEAASRAKTLFLAAMSHEMNTPLNAIIGLSDVLRMQQDGDGETANMLGLISQSGDHMAKLVRDVLDIASDDDVIYDIAELAAIDPVDPLTRAVQSLTALAGENGVPLLWSPPDAPLFIAAVAADIEQLACKLIDNAIKFNRPGGAVKVQLTPVNAGQVRLDIIDSGIGIATKDISRILEPFVQVDEGYSRAVDGTGLGLCVASRIARQHATQLQIRSTPGKGSVFSVLFQCKAPAPHSETKALPETPQPANKEAA
jgi:signal transduction histidine kinase